MVIQIILVVFALFALVRTVWQLKQGSVPFKTFLFWLFFWIAVCVVVLLPQTTTLVASLVGVGRGADLVIYVAMIGLFYLVFRLFVKIEDIERQITKIVRKKALDELDKESK